MPDGSDIVYLYDGSFEGLLCCIFESFEKKEHPVDICAEDEGQMSIYGCRLIASDPEKAERVKAGIRARISDEAFGLVEQGYYTCHPHVERLILNFVRLGMKYGKNTTLMLSNDILRELSRAVSKLGSECGKFIGFLRFSVHGGTMVSVIEPQNFILPLIAPHFCRRYQEDVFMIYDKTHGVALVYRPFESAIIPIENFQEEEADEEERKFRSLWKTFYNTLAIEGRYNPRCRMNFMPKKYWKNMTEVDPKVESRRLSLEERFGPKPDMRPDGPVNLGDLRRLMGNTAALSGGERIEREFKLLTDGDRTREDGGGAE